MEPQLRTFLWVVGSGAFFALLGALFGAITGMFTWQSGRAAGSTVGLTVARAFARAANKAMTPATKGLLIGGVDGFVFLGILGVLIGVFVAWQHPQEWAFLQPLAVGSILLAGAAVSLGGVSYALTQTGTGSVVAFFIGGMSGAILGFALREVDGLLAGAVLGAGTGTLAALALFRRPPSSRCSSQEEELPREDSWP